MARVPKITRGAADAGSVRFGLMQLNGSVKFQKYPLPKITPRGRQCHASTSSATAMTTTAMKISA
jgi:hypothetical protein